MSPTIKHVRQVGTRPAPPFPFSPAVIAGDFVYCSGQCGFHPGTTELVDGGIEEQTRQTMRNLAEILEASGSSLDRVVKALVFLTAEDDFPAFNRVYAEFFPSGSYPARSTVTTGFVAPEVLVEIECVAVRG